MCEEGREKEERREKGSRKKASTECLNLGVEIRGQLSGVGSSTVRASGTGVRFPLTDEPSQNLFSLF